MTRISAAVKPSRPTTYYALLGVAPSAEYRVIHAAYLKLAVELHPDKGGDAERFKQVALAYGVLKNEELRKKYDAALKAESVLNCKRCEGKGMITKTSGFTARRTVECAACAGTGQV